jgi:2-hydroxy-6-oxonona-2,4-dienedioate hydrolase
VLDRLLYRGAPERLATRWRVVAGYRVAERYAERPDAPIVVLLHGIGVSSRYLRPLAGRLAASHTVYAPDLPGFGRSDRLRGGPTVARLSRLLEEWLDAVAPARPDVLVGNSFGCQLLVDLAARRPERVTRLVLLGPTVDRHARTFHQQAAALALDTAREPRGLLPVQAIDYLTHLAKAGPWGFREMLRDAVEERLPRVTAPTLVVRGTRDPIARAAWCDEVVAALPRGELAEIPGAPHAVNYAAADAVAALVAAFAARAPEPTTLAAAPP